MQIVSLARPPLPLPKHDQVYGKVNVPIDKGIINLINALSLFPQLQTIECCQGNSQSPAWVSFYYGQHWEHPWKDLTGFVLEYFGPGIVKQVGDRVDVLIRVAETGKIYCELTVKRGAISLVTKAIKKLYREFNY